MNVAFDINKLSKPQVRRHLRSLRAILSRQQLDLAERQLAINAMACNRLIQAKKILSYAPFSGEISPEKLVTKLSTSSVHLPRITNFRTCAMKFYSASNVESLNKYGIEEPKAIGSPKKANSFDVMLIPLVAFDRQGNRIGMGRGYYDRALAALNHQQSTRPFLVGLAHHFQELKSCQANAWDVPLDAILTDKEFILISNRS